MSLGAHAQHKLFNGYGRGCHRGRTPPRNARGWVLRRAGCRGRGHALRSGGRRILIGKRTCPSPACTPRARGSPNLPQTHEALSSRGGVSQGFQAPTEDEIRYVSCRLKRTSSTARAHLMGLGMDQGNKHSRWSSLGIVGCIHPKVSGLGTILILYGSQHYAYDRRFAEPKGLSTFLISAWD